MSDSTRSALSQLKARFDAYSRTPTYSRLKCWLFQFEFGKGEWMESVIHYKATTTDLRKHTHLYCRTVDDDIGRRIKLMGPPDAESDFANAAKQAGAILGTCIDGISSKIVIPATRRETDPFTRWMYCLFDCAWAKVTPLLNVARRIRNGKYVFDWKRGDGRQHYSELHDLFGASSELVGWLLASLGTPKGKRGLRPPELRTRPMSLGEAARLIGCLGKGTKQKAKWLRKAMDDGQYSFEKKTRQRYIFDKSDFPKEVWRKLTPLGPTSP